MPKQYSVWAIKKNHFGSAGPGEKGPGQALARQAFPYQASHCLLGQEQTYNGLSQERTAGDGDPVIV